MTAAVKSAAAFGFLTAVEHTDFGIFGGYLILNVAGRPLEFHCTAPVKANRAQEILYGPTLRQYLYEQIAPALLAKSKVTPELVCTEIRWMLAAALASPVPLLLVLSDDGGSAGDEEVRFALGKNRVALPLDRAREQAIVEDRWSEAHADQLDLLEPFARIREALEEAQKAAGHPAAIRAGTAGCRVAAA